MASSALSGRKTITAAGTPEQLGTGDVFGFIYVKALVANTGIIELGDVNTAAASGYQLQAGQFVLMHVSKLEDIYVDATVSAEGVSWLRADTARM